MFIGSYVGLFTQLFCGQFTMNTLQNKQQLNVYATLKNIYLVPYLMKHPCKLKFLLGTTYLPKANKL